MRKLSLPRGVTAASLTTRAEKENEAWSGEDYETGSVRQRCREAPRRLSFL